MGPPEDARGCAGIADGETCQVRHHQHENQQRDKPGFIRNLRAEPARAHQKPADEQAEDPSRAGNSKGRSKIGVEAAYQASRIEKSKAKSNCDVVQGNYCKGAETPENKGMCDPG